MAGSSSVAKVMPYNGVLKNMAVFVQENGLTGSTTITAYKNGVATSLVVTVSGGSTGRFYDNTHTASFNKGNNLDTNVHTGQGGEQAKIILSVSYEYEEA